jgi:hypothetical protein
VAWFRRGGDGERQGDNDTSRDEPTDALAPPPGMAPGIALIWSNPALLCDEDVPVARLRELVAAWNPQAEFAERSGATATAFARCPIGGDITFTGPIALGPHDAEALDVDPQWKAAYVAEVPRARIPASVTELAERFPAGIPVDDEGSAWALVQGLAARLGGAARLPGSPLVLPRGDLTLINVYGPQGLDPDALTAVLPESLSSLVLVDLEDFRDGEWLAYRLEDAAGALFVDAERVTAEFSEDLPFAVRARGWRPGQLFEYDLGVAGEGTARDRLRYQFARALVTASEGVLLDEFGFELPLERLTGGHWASTLW